MTEKLIENRGLCLARPTGVDWFRPLHRERLLLQTANQFLWVQKDDEIECVLLTRKPFLTGIGIQVHYSSLSWSRVRTIAEGQDVGLYRIIDHESAWEYFNDNR